MNKITFIVVFVLGIQINFAQNTCDTALPITAGAHVIDAINGTEVSTPVCAANGTGQTAAEWYAYTPTQNFTVTVTSDLSVNICKDTRVHIYTGTCGTLTCITGDDDDGIIACNSGNTNAYLSTATFTVTAGVTYYIVWDNKWSPLGLSFQLTEAPIVVPPPGPVTFTSQNIATINSSYNICVVDMNNDFLDDIVGVSANNIRDIKSPWVVDISKPISNRYLAKMFIPNWAYPVEGIASCILCKSKNADVEVIKKRISAIILSRFLIGTKIAITKSGIV
jgi:hypothetical protein